MWDSEDGHTSMACRLGGAMVCFRAHFSVIAFAIMNDLLKTKYADSIRWMRLATRTRELPALGTSSNGKLGFVT